MNNCKSYSQYLALILGQKQRQRPARFWPRPARKAPRPAPRVDPIGAIVKDAAMALCVAMCAITVYSIVLAIALT